MTVHTEWSGKLDSPDLPGAAALFYAVHGDPGEQFTLVANQSLALDAMYFIAVERPGEDAMGLTQNPAVPTEVLEILALRFPDEVDFVNNHPNASLARKRSLTAVNCSGYTLAKFFESVRATSAEEAKYHVLLDDAPAMTTLGALWSSVRKI